MLALVKKNSAFFIPYFLFLLLGGVLLISVSKPDIYFFINKFHSPTADMFFEYWTNVGLGWIIIPVVIALAFVRLRYVIIVLASSLATITINDGIKFAVGAPRPAEVLSEQHHAFYTVPGFELDHWNSFPSGHTAMAFCIFLLLALIANRKSLKFIFFLAAFLVAYSRMYLSEHFLIDVYVASVIAVVSTMSVYLVGMELPWLNRFAAIDKPIINVRKKQ